MLLLTGRRSFKLQLSKSFCVATCDYQSDDGVVKIVDSGRPVSSLEDGICSIEKMIASGCVPSYKESSLLFNKLVKAGNLEGSDVVLTLMLNLGYTPNSFDVGAFIRGLCKAGMVKVAFEVLSTVSQNGNFNRGFVFEPILRSFCQYSKMYTALSFLGWLNKKGFILDVNSYTALVHGFSKKKLWGHVDHCLNEMKRAECKPDAVIYTVIIKSLCDDGKVDEAKKILQEMEAAGCNPDVVTNTIIIKALCVDGKVDEPLKILQKMKAAGCDPNVVTYTVIIKSLCDELKVDEALKILQEMEAAGCYPNVVTYTVIIKSLCVDGKIAEALKILQEMEAAGCDPNVVTYTVIIKSLCDDGKVNEALNLLQQMEAAGCDPDLVSFNIILRELGRQGRSSEINSLLEVMEHKGLSPNTYTVAGIAGGMLQAGKVERAYVLLHNIISKGWSINDVVYDIFLNSVCLLKGSKEALRMVPKMMEWGFRPSNWTYNTILKGLLTENHIDESCRLCHHIKPTNAPDLISFNIMLSAAAKQEDSAMLRRILWRMEREGIEPNVITKTCLIKYYSRIGDIQQCFHILKFMLENDCRPNTFTLNTLLIGLCNNRLLGMAKWIFDYFKTHGISPNRFTYEILLRASIREHNVSLVNELLRDMYG